MAGEAQNEQQSISGTTHHALGRAVRPTHIGDRTLVRVCASVQFQEWHPHLHKVMTMHSFSDVRAKFNPAMKRSAIPLRCGYVDLARENVVCFYVESASPLLDTGQVQTRSTRCLP
jgi:hypothetical protein